MIRLIIADDHPIVREGLRHVVSQSNDIRVVGEAEDGEAALELCRTMRADVILLDVSMPGPGVLELIPRLKEIQPLMHILILSVHPEQHYGRRVFQAGADGYLTKSHSPQALGTAIRTVYAGRKYITTTLAEELAVDLGRSREGEPHERLSNREYQVFLQLGAGNSVHSIAEQLRLSPKTVRTYKSRILEKTELKSTADLIFYAVQRGLVSSEKAAAPAAPAAAEAPASAAAAAAARVRRGTARP
jgi:two-component system invasion response regulator UvrY